MLSKSIHAVVKVRFPSFLQPSSIPLHKYTTAFSCTHLVMGTWFSSSMQLIATQLLYHHTVDLVQSLLQSELQNCLCNLGNFEEDNIRFTSTRDRDSLPGLRKPLFV